MSRLVFLSIAIVLSLLPVVAPAAPAHKRPAPRWHGYGFLPGYHQPPNNSLPAYRPESFGFAHGAPQPAPLVYRSNPKLLRVRWRLALFRPAWLLRRSLQWRQLRPLLDADADRADLELRLMLKDRARVRLRAARRHGQLNVCKQIAADSVDAVERGHDISCTVDPGHCSGARYERAAKHRSRHRAF